MRTFRFMAIAFIATFAISAQAAILTYTTNMDGPSEAPPNASPGVGTSTVTIDTVLNTMRVEIEFSGLLGMTTACHIHAPTAVPLAGTAGVATQTPTFSGFPNGVMAGTYDMTFDMTLASSYNPGFISNNGGTVDGARAALFAAIDQGRAYVNIHSSVFPGGEIRGFLVPEPASFALFGLAGLALLRRR